MVTRLLPLLLIGGAGLLLARQQTLATTTPGQGGASGAGGWFDRLDLGLGEFGDGWAWSAWSFEGSTNTTPPANGGDMSAPRGIRNNNPGNIEYDPRDHWRGLADPPSDGRYARFTEPKWGIRAMARTLDTYATSHGLDYVGGIINRWAPVHDDNPTTAYITYVADHLGVSPTERIDVLARRPELIEAMIAFENGQQPYSMATIREGVALA